MTIFHALMRALGCEQNAPEPVDVTAILDAKASHAEDWRHSVVDLMKCVGIDSSLPARREMAAELGYPGSLEATGAMNVWLHAEIMRRLAANGGIVPQELLG